MSRFLPALSALLIAGVSLPAMADPFLVTYEAPTSQNTTTKFNYVGVETFDTRQSGTFTTTFGTSNAPTVISGTYTGITINRADQFGGADGTGNYGVTFATGGYSLSLSATNAPITYFGFWLSALDNGNQLTFYRDNDVVYRFLPADVVALIGNCSGGSNPYCGNPNQPFRGADSTEPFVFLNFYDGNTLGFNKIVFTEDPSVGGYESDNHTVGYYTTITGTPVPEPASIVLFSGALMALGVLRHRSSRH